jgi:hypothetical protein
VPSHINDGSILFATFAILRIAIEGSECGVDLEGRPGYGRSDLSPTIMVATDGSSCLFTVIYQRRLHFGIRAGLLGPTTGQRRSSHPITYQGGSSFAGVRVEKLAIEREDCVSWHLRTTRTLLEVHIRQAVCHFAEIPHGF